MGRRLPHFGGGIVDDDTHACQQKIDVARHASRVTRHASHVTRHASHVTRHTHMQRQHKRDLVPDAARTAAASHDDHMSHICHMSRIGHMSHIRHMSRIGHMSPAAAAAAGRARPCTCKRVKTVAVVMVACDV